MAFGVVIDVLHCRWFS